MTLAAAVTRLQALALSCAGMRAAPVYPKEQVNTYPYSVCYPESGQLMSESFHATRALHTVLVEFHIAPRTMLGEAVEKAIPFVEAYNEKLTLDPTLSGACSNILLGQESNVTYQFGRLEWGGVENIGIRFRITIKIRGEAA